MAGFSTFRMARNASLVSLALALCAQSATISAQEAADGADEGGLDDIVVTATRQTQVLSKVPISIAAFGQEQMDAQGVKQVDDLTRLTPGLNLTRGNYGSANISIRGISSTAGAATTGIYIDDTPIQIRGGNGAGTAFPIIFDLERVEVLRGPQGTLFGAGSQGGTIRFIQVEPSLTDYSMYGRAELSKTKHGGWGNELGFAIGGPIIQDKLGFRVSAFYRRDAGYIDRVAGTMAVTVANGSVPGKSVSFSPSSIRFEDSNWSDSWTVRAALKAQPTETLTITPSIFYQKQHFNDGNIFFWDAASPNRKDGDLVFPIWLPGDPATDSRLRTLNAPVLNDGDDRFVLPSLLIEWELPFMTVVSNTSYFDRKAERWYDNTIGYTRSIGGYTPPKAGDRGSYSYTPNQKNWVQELRLQSADPDARLTWLVGGFVSRMKQKNELFIGVNFFETLPTIYGVSRPNGAPFGPGYSTYQNYYGVPMLPNSGTYFSRTLLTDKQYAAFGQVDFDITSKLSVSAGVRVASNEFTFDAFFDGPENVLNAPSGRPCPAANAPCLPGQAPFVPIYNRTSVGAKETAVTPKFGITYQADDKNMFYATVAKGFRPGAAQVPLPGDCNNDLKLLGYVDANGNARTPNSFDADSVWSYEIGSKNKLFNNRVTIDASAYIIKWKKIQTSISVPNCGYAFTINLDNATSRGFDLALNVRPVDSLQVGVTLGYTKATYDVTSKNFSGGVIVSEGSGIGDSGSPWTMVLSGAYEAPEVNGIEPYMRADFTYSSKWRRTGQTDPLAVSYDAFQPVRPSTSLVNARVGAKIGPTDVSLFVNNLLNSSPDTGLSHGRGNPVWTNWTFRPRMIGITLVYRD